MPPPACRAVAYRKRQEISFPREALGAKSAVIARQFGKVRHSGSCGFDQRRALRRPLARHAP
jgi:hypothetical protein